MPSLQIRFASLQRLGTEYIISRAPFGHTPNDTGSGLQPLLAAYMPPLRISLKGLRPLQTSPGIVPKLRNHNEK